MPKLILVTVGTSALERCRNPKEYQDLEKLVDDLNREGDSSQLYNNVKVQVAERLQKNLKRYLGGRDPDYRRLSAETASLLAMRKDKDIGKITSGDKIALLYSDTIDGKLCAEVNAKIICENLMNCSDPITEVLEKDGDGRDVVTIFKPSAGSQEIIQMIRLVGLQHQNARDFVKKGLTNLFARTKELLETHLPSKWNRFVNITGGYKGEIPIQTLQAESKNVPIVYLFEHAELVKIIFKDDGSVEIWLGNQPDSPSSTFNPREYEIVVT